MPHFLSGCEVTEPSAVLASNEESVEPGPCIANWGYQIEPAATRSINSSRGGLYAVLRPIKGVSYTNDGTIGREANKYFWLTVPEFLCHRLTLDTDLQRPKEIRFGQ